MTVNMDDLKDALIYLRGAVEVLNKPAISMTDVESAERWSGAAAKRFCTMAREMRKQLEADEAAAIAAEDEMTYYGTHHYGLDKPSGKYWQFRSRARRANWVAMKGGRESVRASDPELKKILRNPKLWGRLVAYQYTVPPKEEV